MKKIYIIILLVSLFSNVFAQSGLLMNRYYITGSLSVGRYNRGFADSSAWLQVGPDTTNRGILFPKVLLDSVSTSARALFVYDLKDSVLYHFDGNKKVRYMTYKDTALVKQIVLANQPNLSVYVAKADSATYLPTKSFLASAYYANGGNTYGADATLGVRDNYALSLLTGNTPRLKIYNNGNVSIAATTDAGYKLYVNGTSRIVNELYVEKGITFPNNTQGIQLTHETTNGHYPSIMIGRNNGTYPTTGNRHIKLGVDNTGNAARSCQYAIGAVNNLSAAGNFAVAIGTFNTINTEDTDHTILGTSNVFNYVGGSQSRGQCIIGANNSVLHSFCSIIGNYQSTTANNQLIIADGNNNSSAGGYRQVFFGSGPRSSLNGGLGAPVTINASGGNGTDKQGGLLRLAAGKSTGAAIAPDLIFATATASVSGTSLQPLSDRWYVKGESGFLSNNANPTSLLDINAAQGYSQLRLRTSYTPTSSADANGNVGDVCWDGDYIYVKTAAGWKRTTLSSF